MFQSQLARLSSSRVIFPMAAAVVASAGYAYHASCTNFVANETGKAFTGGNDWIDLKVAKTEALSHDTQHITFDLPNKEDVSGLITASLLLAKFVTEKGSNVIRPYTPVSDPEQTGTIEFVIKGYEGGKMSSHVVGLKKDDTLSFKGPIVKWKWEANQFKSIALIGGGTGITPLYQLINEITKNPNDNTKVQLFYGSKTPEDILIKDKLDILAKKHSQLEIHYFVDKAAESWKDGTVGYITTEVLKKHLPAPSGDLKVFVCGPPPLYQSVSGAKVSPTDQGEVTGALAELGFTKENVFKF